MDEKGVPEVKMNEFRVLCVFFLQLLFVSACGRLDGSAIRLPGDANSAAGQAGSPGGLESWSGVVSEVTEPARFAPSAQITPVPTTAVPTPPVFLPATPTVETLLPEESAGARLTVVTQGAVICTLRNDWPQYSVRPGDILGRIARRAGTSAEQLAEANCLADPDRLYPGQTLYVPRAIDRDPTPTATEPAASSRWVRIYDQLYRIALECPEAWQDVSQGAAVKRAGEDGFVQLSGVGAPYDLDEVTAHQAYHKLQPFGSAPTIERITLRDGRAAHLIWPSVERQNSGSSYAMLVTPFAEPVPVGNHRLNFLTLTADLDHMRRIATSLELPPAPAAIGVNFFDVSAEELPAGGRRVTFTWDSHGATRGKIISGTSERFMDWWPVEAFGQHMVDLHRTFFADPTMTLQLFNDVSGREAVETVRLSWPCQHDYFFSPAPEHCPHGEALRVRGAFQQFEHGFMIWLPRPDNGYPSIFAFQDTGQVLHYPDTWTIGDPETDPDLEPPQGLHQPVRGFGKVWREYAGLRDQLGWATMPEYAYQASYQIELRESTPGVSYLTRPEGTILQLVDTRWSLFAAAAE
jgi:LysM repeat protein